MKPGALKALVFCGALLPLAWVGYRGYTGDLTANPIEYITHHTGWFALMFLVSSLSVTPVRRLTGWQPIIRFRRMLGLFAFFYGTLHFSIWFVLDRFFSFTEMANDVVKRPFITAGMTTLLLLAPLAVTSTKGMIRRLGGQRWMRLHRLAYVAAITAVFHFWWLVKSDIREPRRWAIGVALLLGLRAWWMFQARLSSRS